MSIHSVFQSIVIVFLFIVVWGFQTEMETKPVPEKPNIIVMYSDDHTAQAIGAYRGALNYGLQLDRNRDEPFMMIYNHKAPHREWLPGPKHLNDYRDRDLPEPATLFYDYSGLTTAAHEQDMEIGTTLRWGADLKVPLHPETGEPNEDWQNVIVERNRLTDEQLQRIEDAYAEDNEWELFDLETDPNQLTSVYGDPDYEEIKQQLKNKIIELQEQYGDDSWGD